MFQMKNQEIWLRIYGVLTAIIAVITYLIFSSPAQNLEIYILDVGQGDAILIKTMDQKYVLVDAGPDEDVVRELQQVMPFWERSLDLVILTHPDQDHVGGMPAVFDYYDVNAVSYLPVEHENRAFDEFREDIWESEIENWRLDSDDDFSLGCCTFFDMLWPTEEIFESCDITADTRGETCQYDVNDASAAFVLVYKDFAIYFGGDLGSKFEEEIFSENKYDLDAIKVGHHGSKTSTSLDFLGMTKPEYAYISVGEDNRFDHPHEVVLQNLEQYDVEVHRTDQEGTVEIGY
ncbi:MBL fold metallo-hydrolase [Candidatus Dojkabacteria bacterium]|nr:MBL fold metallo-hydrolase [Candidatus Dojkabacteria bacterium]